MHLVPLENLVLVFEEKLFLYFLKSNQTKLTLKFCFFTSKLFWFGEVRNI